MPSSEARHDFPLASQRRTAVATLATATTESAVAAPAGISIDLDPARVNQTNGSTITFEASGPVFGGA
jgi:hypothetical protein